MEVTIAGVGVSLLIALVTMFAPLRADVRDLRSDVHSLSERVARIEGALSGPYRLPAAAPEKSE